VGTAHGATVVRVEGDPLGFVLGADSGEEFRGGLAVLGLMDLPSHDGSAEDVPAFVVGVVTDGGR